MTLEEFLAKFTEEFSRWAGDRPRPVEFWWLAMERFSGMEYNREVYRVHNEQKGN